MFKKISLILVITFFSSAFAMTKSLTLTNGMKISLESNHAPIIYQLEKMIVKLPDPEVISKVRLYHPGINHYSSDPVINYSESLIRLENVFFIKEGIWQMIFLSKNKEKLGFVEFDIKPFTKVRDVTTHAIMRGDTYKGAEFYNGKPTGASCYVVIESVSKNKKGLHCYDITWRYMTNRTDVPSNFLKVSSRITNYHRPEYPRRKTCAKNVDGTSDGADIYSEDTSFLVNDIFNGLIKENRTEFHTFLSISKNKKELYQSRIHGLTWRKEWDVDCKSLRLVD